MCRWLAYSGSPVLLEELLYKPAHSLIDQSLHSRLGATTTNGDGFGIGWYGGSRYTRRVPRDRAGVERPQPSRHRGSHLVPARLRAHPRLDRDRDPGDELPSVPARPLAVDAQRADPRVPARQAGTGASRSTRPSTPEIEGSTDSELFFFLALTFGLEDDPPLAVERVPSGLIEETGRRHGVEHPIQMTVATTNGDSVWAFRYSSEGNSRSLFVAPTCARSAPSIRTTPCYTALSDETRLVVSEPLGDLVGAWNEVPEASWGVVQAGQDELHSFAPR